MENWKELRKDNLPPDILTGDYEFQYFDSVLGRWRGDRDPIVVLVDLLDEVEYRYRKEEKPKLKHSEILTKWFKYENVNVWFKILFYNYDNDEYVNAAGLIYPAAHLNKLEHADIPPKKEE